MISGSHCPTKGTRAWTSIPFSWLLDSAPLRLHLQKQGRGVGVASPSCSSLEHICRASVLSSCSPASPLLGISGLHLGLTQQMLSQHTIKPRTHHSHGVRACLAGHRIKGNRTPFARKLALGARSHAPRCPDRRPSVHRHAPASCARQKSVHTVRCAPRMPRTAHRDYHAYLPACKPGAQVHTPCASVCNARSRTLTHARHFVLSTSSAHLSRIT